PTGKSGASLSGKSSGKPSFGSTVSKTSTGSFGSTSKSSTSKVSGKTPIFGTSKPSTGLAPSTSKHTYENTAKSGKSSFGIIWLPTKKRNKKTDMVYSSVNNDRKNERSPSMYKLMSGDSSDLQGHKRKDEEASLLVPERLKGPIATAASAGTVAAIAEAPSETADLDEKLLKHDNTDIKGKSADKVDSVYVTQTSIKVPPRSTASVPEEEDCGIKCLYYTLQCCDCVL
ncbi:Serine/threonine-protein kinase rio2, partial [Operophtera brumata]